MILLAGEQDFKLSLVMRVLYDSPHLYPALPVTVLSLVHSTVNQHSIILELRLADFFWLEDSLTVGRPLRKAGFRKHSWACGGAEQKQEPGSSPAGGQACGPSLPRPPSADPTTTLPRPFPLRLCSSLLCLLPSCPQPKPASFLSSSLAPGLPIPQSTCARWCTSMTACPSTSVRSPVSPWAPPSTAGSTTPAASASAPSVWTTAARPSSA